MNKKVMEMKELKEELVPVIGRAKTAAGEIVRAYMKLEYRFFNDGDHIGIGYGNHTCNAPARFLIARGGTDISKIVNDMWGERNEYNYFDLLKMLEEEIVTYIAENQHLLMVENTEDMLVYGIPEDEEGWMDEDEEDDYFDDSPAWDDDSDRSCSDCPPDECTGRCFSCYYRTV